MRFGMALSTLPWLGTREIGNSGFRFVRVDLVSPGVLSLESLRAVSLMRPMPQLGSFTCSDERLNQDLGHGGPHAAPLLPGVHLGRHQARPAGLDGRHASRSHVADGGVRPAGRVDGLTRLHAQDHARRAWMNGMPSYTLWWIRCQHDWYRYTGDLAYLKKPSTRTFKPCLPIW
jgi:alpha-L-rhamnosidase